MRGADTAHLLMTLGPRTRLAYLGKLGNSHVGRGSGVGAVGDITRQNDRSLGPALDEGSFTIMQWVVAERLEPLCTCDFSGYGSSVQ